MPMLTLQRSGSTVFIIKTQSAILNRFDASISNFYFPNSGQQNLTETVWFFQHSHKTVYDLLSDRLSIVPPEVLGEDKKGFSYLYFPAFTDLRVYRQSKSTYSKFNINRWEKIVRVPVANGDTDCPPSKCVLPSKNDFELLATSISELRNVYSNLVETEFSSKSNCDNKSSPLLENIDRLLKDWSSLESKHSINLSHIRQKMYREWKTLYDR